MLREKKLRRWGIMGFVLLLVVLLFCAMSIQAQYWTNLPPYNLIWPLWSPPLSPLSPVTKLPTPLISWLDKNTILPVQPGLAWDPIAFPKGPPFLLYNVPPPFGGGLLWWTSTYGLNPFPPSYLTTPSGYPIPIALDPGFTALLPTKAKHFISWIQVANLLYATTYGSPLTGLITAADIWGLPAL